jgi:hypothetical protein
MHSSHLPKTSPPRITNEDDSLSVRGSRRRPSRAPFNAERPSLPAPINDVDDGIYNSGLKLFDVFDCNCRE